MAEIPKNYGAQGIGLATASGSQPDLNDLLRSLLTDVQALRDKQAEIITEAGTSLAAIAALTAVTLGTSAEAE